MNIRDAGCLERRQETTDHSGASNAGDGTSTGWCEGTEDTDLDTEGSEIGEPAKGVRSDGVGTR